MDFFSHHTLDRPSKISTAFFWGLFIVLWIVSIGLRPLIHPDEGRYAMLSLGMLESGDWVTPRLNGVLYFEKPPFSYWMGAISFSLFGVNEFAARCWPALAGLLSVLTVGLTARKLYGNAQLAACVMGGSVWIIANSHFLNLDTGLLFFLTLTVCAFVWAQDEATSRLARRLAMLIAWAGIAGATLSKGLIGILIPGGALFLYSLFRWHWGIWLRMSWLWGILVFSAITVPWFWLVSARNPDFAHFFFIHEHVERFLTTTHGRTEPFWYFLPVLFIGFLPWVSFLPRLLWEGAQGKAYKNFHVGSFLIIWFGFTFVFFSLSGSKLPSYILPLFPALALLLGKTLNDARAASLKKHLILPLLVWSVITSAYFLSGFIKQNSDTPPEAYAHLALFMSIGGVFFLAAGVSAWVALNKHKKHLAIMLLAMGSLISVLISSVGHNPIGVLKSSKYVTQTLAPYLHQDTKIFSVRMYEQTFPFYLGRPVVLVDYRDEFSFGQKIEPQKSLPTLEAFIEQWRTAPSAIAMLQEPTLRELEARKLPMKIVYEDLRRKIIVKP